MQQIFQAYADTISWVAREYGPWIAGAVVALLAVGVVLRFIAGVRIGRGPGER
jgi:hypothetical protein